MSTEIKKEIQLEIAHVLFMDIVGYSKRLINEQRTLLEELNQIVRSTDEFRNAEAAGKLIKIPTGDGMALVFYNSPEEPVECALDISRALKTHPKLPLRMGVHSGPVSGVVDVNERANVAGAGINMAQRVMDCGDAGHILLSKRVAEDLEQYEHWLPHLHELGECEVKHGVRVSVVNLYTDELGNPEPPEKFKQLRGKKKSVGAGKRQSGSDSAAGPTSNRKYFLVAAAVAVTLAVTILLFTQRQSSRSVSAVAPPILEKSVAVLPFENLSRDPDNAYFATGIQDEILTRLAKIAALRVISRTSTQQYAAKPGNLSEIARQLNVANILEGSVQRAGDQVQINAQLIRASTDEHLWAESYDRKLENIFGVEAEVATAVAEALKAKLSGAERNALAEKLTSNPEAYDAYLRGIALYREDNFVARLKAADAFAQAVQIDPSFATAWAMLSRANSFRYNSSATTERQAAAKSSLDKALSLNPDLAEVQMAQGFYQYWVLRDFASARRTFERLRPKFSNSADIPEALGMIASRQGRWDERRALFDEAVKLNPRDRILRLQVAWERWASRDFSKALQFFDEALTIWPGNPTLIDGKAEIYQSLGKLDDADRLLKDLRPTTENIAGLDTIANQAILRRQPASAIPLLKNWLDQGGFISQGQRSSFRTLLGDLQRLSGNAGDAKISYSRARDELEAALKEQPAENPWISALLADTYAGLGERERSLSFANRALSLMPYSKDATVSPRFEEKRARIAARFGLNDLAIPALERLLEIPYYGPITPALLRLDPDFDLLRGDPRFEKLAHSDGK